MRKTQSNHNKKGEVVFRKKLAQQFDGKKIIYPGEPTGPEYTEIVKGRIKDYTGYFDQLRKKNILQGPYLELGAGVGQGAMLLENTYNLQGFTCDISYETLRLAPKFQKTLKFTKMPLRICCDIYNLPFRTGSMPFVFTFQTLHHLPDPLPVLLEVKRVLSPGGYFYFNEEPVAQAFNLNLWRRDRHLRWFEKILKMLVVLHFISRIGKSEIEHNILEETFSLSIWERALNIFQNVSVQLRVFPLGPSYTLQKTKQKGWIKKSTQNRFLMEILGGGIGSICQNANGKIKIKPINLLDCLACPNCKSKPKLFIQQADTFICKQCKSEYKNKNGVLILLSHDQKKLLYPKN